MTETLLRYSCFRYSWRTWLVLLFIFMAPLLLNAQETEPKDTAAADESYKEDSAYQNPHKAAILSAIIPGLGQVYNKKYWKVPIVYAGFGTFAFFIHYNEKGYLKWRQAYIDYPDYARLVQMVFDAAVFVANADHAPRLDAPKPTDPHVRCRQ